MCEVESVKTQKTVSFMLVGVVTAQSWLTQFRVHTRTTKRRQRYLPLFDRKRRHPAGLIGSIKITTNVEWTRRGIFYS